MNAVLAQRHPAAPPGLLRWLQRHCDSSAAVSAGVVVLGDAADGVPSAEWPALTSLTPALVSAARAAGQRGRPVVVVPAVRLVGAQHNRIIALPLRQGARHVQGAVALAVQVDAPADVERLLRELGQACAMLRQLVLAGRDPDAAVRRRALRELLQTQARLLEARDLAAGALALVTDLAAQLGAERVSLGLAGAGGETLQLLAVSRSAELRPEQALQQALLEAQQEAADQADVVAWPADATEPARIVLAHLHLHQLTGHVLLDVPLVARSRVVGALLVEWRHAEDADLAPGAPMRTRCEDVAAAIGPLLALRRRADRSWPAHTAEALRRQWHRLGRGGDARARGFAAAAALTLAGAALVPLPWRLSAPARLEGEVQRVVAAPFDGYLQRAPVRPGDRVRAGDLLAELADQDLQLEARKWEYALAQQENAEATALARADRAQFVIAHGKAQEARSQLELVRQQLARTRLLAPIDGVVIQGDPGQALGAPVQRGETLLTVAPAGRHRLVLEVDERDIAAVQPGQAGRLTLAAQPGEPLALLIERVTPVARVRDGRNAFEVQARLQAGEAQAQALRPGQLGLAAIEVGQRTLAAQAWQRLSDGLHRLGWLG